MVTNVVSRSQGEDLISFLFSFPFYFLFNLFSIFLFLELRVRVSNNLTSDSDCHKSHDSWKDKEGSRRMTLYDI